MARASKGSYARRNAAKKQATGEECLQEPSTSGVLAVATLSQKQLAGVFTPIAALWSSIWLWIWRLIRGSHAQLEPEAPVGVGSCDKTEEESQEEPACFDDKEEQEDVEQTLLLEDQPGCSSDEEEAVEDTVVEDRVHNESEGEAESEDHEETPFRHDDVIYEHEEEEEEIEYEDEELLGRPSCISGSKEDYSISSSSGRASSIPDDESDDYDGYVSVPSS